MPLADHIDINCDLGEGMGQDGLIMPFISSANVSCGLHAGDRESIRETLLSCIEHGVAIGAHPSFDDRENFGRLEMHLPPDALANLVRRQLDTFMEWVDALGAQVRHVKPHGALYNLSARDRQTADIIAATIAGYDNSLVLYGLSGSCSIDAGLAAGLPVAREAFADRSYLANGQLTPRSDPRALHSNIEIVVGQVLELIRNGAIHTIDGSTLSLTADTICIHGDGPHALEFARHIHATLRENNIRLLSPPINQSPG